MPETKLILGQTLGFTANPFETPVAEAARYVDAAHFWSPMAASWPKAKPIPLSLPTQM